MAKKKIDELETLVGQVEGAGKALLGKLQAALGVESREAAISLIRADSEARSIARKILGAEGPLGMKAALGVESSDDQLAGGVAKRRNQSTVTF